ncbi:MAG: hypothetical protein NC916_00700, partial [Candidatus Omnitrophica bacterium]|nr:hypothetical protein [Candidatus Omnitrophota bacterium]
QVIASGVSKGNSDTADAYSGKYTGSYTWTVPAAATASSTLKLRVRSGSIIGVCPGHFRIKGGFVFRDENTPSMELPSTTDWKANTTHTIKWYNRGTFSTIKLEYRTALTLSDLGIASWTTISGADSYSNIPDVNNISSYTWTVPDPNLANLPTEPPEYYYVQLKISSTSDPTVNNTSNAFKISYYTVTWVLKDDETMSLLDNLGARSSVGSTLYWNVATGDLVSTSDPRYAGTTFPHRYPSGTYTTIWSKTGYFDTTDADRQITQDATYTVLMESTTPKEYRVGNGFSYNEIDDILMIKIWLEKKGMLVTSDSVNKLGTGMVEIYYGTTLVGSVNLTLDDTTGYYYAEVKNATGEVGVPDANGDLGFGLTAGKTYFAKCSINYGGATGTRSTYSAGASFDITVAQSLAAATAEIKDEVAGVKSFVATEIASTQNAITEKITAESIATQAKVTEVKTETARILTASETTIPSAITSAKDTLVTSIRTEVKPFVQSGILTRESIVKSGDTITISYKTASGLSPKITVYDPNNAKKINNATMTEVGTTGVYEYAVKFLSGWGKGDFNIVCSESTLGTIDALTITVVTQDIESVASSVSSILGTTSGLSDVDNTVSLLNAQFGQLDDTLSKLSEKLAGKVSETKEAVSDLESVYNQLVELSKTIQEMAGSSTGINLEKLYEVSKEKKEDLIYLKNKSEELKAAMEINQKMLESTAKKPIVQTWFEFR